MPDKVSFLKVKSLSNKDVSRSTGANGHAAFGYGLNSMATEALLSPTPLSGNVTKCATRGRSLGVGRAQMYLVFILAYLVQ